MDVVALARDVIAEIDLPEIIRDSTGAMASDTLLGVRMQSISGDDAIARAMDRLRLRLTRAPSAGWRLNRHRRPGDRRRRLAGYGSHRARTR